MPHDWSDAATALPQSNRRRIVDATARRIASRQKHLITGRQLSETGLPPRTQRHRAANGRLFRIHPGVFALHPPPYCRDQERLAAIYACGPGSVVSHWEAAALQGLTEALTSHIAVTNRTGRGGRFAGIHVHRAVIDPPDRVGVRSIPCTSAARTVIDLAHSANNDELEELLLAADSKRTLNHHRLEELLAERHGLPGTRKLRSLITDDPVGARSVNERRLFAICREAGVPLPLVNHRIDVPGRTFYADFCWPDLRLIVEADSWRWHGGRSAKESDADRDQLLSVAGWRVVHFTRDQILNRRAETGRRLVALTVGIALP